MIKNIVVSAATHPELYKPGIDLGLDAGVGFDIGGDVVIIDTERKLIYRLPFSNDRPIIIHHGDNKDLEYLFNGEGVR